MSAPIILLTGFEPFGGERRNPSAEVATALDGRRIAGATVRSAILPVQHDDAWARFEPLLAEIGPRAIVHLGLAGGRARVALERVAVNVMDYEIADNAGYRARGEPCVPGGPPAYFATLPLPAMRDALIADGIPAYVSHTAGTYLCNQTLYQTLHALASRPPGADRPIAGFVHLPLLPAMVAESGTDQASMDLGLMVRAVEIVLPLVLQ